MSSFDDELRVALKERARHVGPPADPMAGIEDRVRSIQRRRTATSVAGSALSLLLIAGAVTFVHRAVERPGSEITAGQELAAPPLLRMADPHALQPAVQAPRNRLDWPRRGLLPPRSLTEAGRNSLATRLRVPASSVHTEGLWAGRMPGVGWVYVAQGWSNASKAATREALVTVVRANTEGYQARAVTNRVIAFQHAGPDVDAVTVRREVGRIAMLTFPLDERWLLVLGAPGVNGLSYAADGVTFRSSKATEGAALFQRTPPQGTEAPIELVQARDEDGRVLTRPDTAAYVVAATRGVQVSGREPASAWGLDEDE